MFAIYRREDLMKNCIQFIVVLASILFLSHAVATDKMGIGPLNSVKKSMAVVTVSPAGGDFTDPVAAVKSIKDADATNPYEVLIGPGKYTLSQTLVMKPFVTIAGSGPDVTTLTGAISSDVADETSAIVTGADYAALYNLTIENRGVGRYSIALYNKWSSPFIQNVSAAASGGVGFNYGVYNYFSSPRMTEVTAAASGGGTSSIAVYNDSSSPRMTKVNAVAAGGMYSIGVYNDSSSPKMIEMTAVARGGQEVNVGVGNYNSSPIMIDLKAGSTGDTILTAGVHDSISSPIIQYCTLYQTDKE
jgi:hypothetical protein